jgi:hypothetical protein
VTSAAEHDIIKHGKREKDMVRLREKLRIHLHYILLICDGAAGHYRFKKNKKKNNNNISYDDYILKNLVNGY